MTNTSAIEGVWSAVQCSAEQYSAVHCSMPAQHSCNLAHVRILCLQIVGIDVQAIALALTACFIPALKQMSWHQPGPISTGPTFILLGIMALLAMLVQVINMVVLHQQSWFTGSSGLPEQVWSPVKP